MDRSCLPVFNRADSPGGSKRVSAENISDQCGRIVCHRGDCGPGVEEPPLKSEARAVFKDGSLRRLYYVFLFRPGDGRADKKWKYADGAAVRVPQLGRRHSRGRGGAETGGISEGKKKRRGKEKWML